MAMVTTAAILLAVSVSAYPSDTDDRIESSFINSFVYKKYLVDEHIEITSENGIVVLSGTAVSDANKTMAQDTAEALPGVKSVDNRIQLKEDPPSEYSDMWVHMKVKSVLLYYRNVSGIKTEIAVKEGVATLTGEAANLTQKDLTTEYVKDVVGVKEVNNEMTLAANPTEPEKTWMEAIDDASITAQVKGALMWNRSTSALQTGVKTNDGVVTVSGKASNASEKALVTKLVADIHGVKSVINEMTIAG